MTNNLIENTNGKLKRYRSSHGDQRKIGHGLVFCYISFLRKSSNRLDTIYLAVKFFNFFEKQNLLSKSNRKLSLQQTEKRECYDLLYEFLRNTNSENETFSDIDPVALIIRKLYDLLCKIKN